MQQCKKCDDEALVTEVYGFYCARCWVKEHDTRPPKRTLSREPKAKLCFEDVALVRELLDDGMLSMRQIAEKFDVSHNAIWSIANDKSWRTV